MSQSDSVDTFIVIVEDGDYTVRPMSPEHRRQIEEWMARRQMLLSQLPSDAIGVDESKNLDGLIIVEDGDYTVRPMSPELCRKIEEWQERSRAQRRRSTGDSPHPEQGPQPT